jgi:fatty-acid desaturase
LEQQKAKHPEILDDLWTFFVEENRVVLTVLYWAVLWMIAPAFLFYVVLTGRFLYSIFITMAAIGGHTKLPFGYRNFDTPDTTHNNLLFHYVCLGLMPSQLQNNHHGSMQHSCHWYEVDTGGLVVKLLRPLLTKQQPL